MYTLVPLLVATVVYLVMEAQAGKAAPSYQIEPLAQFCVIGLEDWFFVPAKLDAIELKSFSMR